MKRRGIFIIVFIIITVMSFLTFNTLHLQAAVRTLQNEKLSLAQANDNLAKDLQTSQNRVQELEQSAVCKPPAPSGKVAYLTFDDGPSANTTAILDILQRYQVKATFFVIGSTSTRDIALYQRIVADGHTIALHGYTHDYAVAYQSADAYMNNLYRLQDWLEQKVGIKPTITRFLGGSNSSMGAKYGGADLAKILTARVQAEGLQYFDWNVSSTDASAPVQATDVIVNAVLSGAKQHQQAVILMHDAPMKTTTVEALPQIIAGLQSQGFAFSRITPSTPPVHFVLK